MVGDAEEALGAPVATQRIEQHAKCAIEREIGPHQPNVHRGGLLPAEELRVEAKRRLPLPGDELVPREVAVRRLRRPRHLGARALEERITAPWGSAMT